MGPLNDKPNAEVINCHEKHQRKTDKTGPVSEIASKADEATSQVATFAPKSLGKADKP